MAKICDNKSVGMLIYNQNKELLLIERKKFPFGFAPPAGHIDDHGGPEEAAKVEVSEEVGLTVESLSELCANLRKENPCRREGGTHHNWWIYEVETSGEIDRSLDETKSAGWYTQEQINSLAEKTRLYKNGEISEEDWEKSPGLEPIWYDFFVELKILTQ